MTLVLLHVTQIISGGSEAFVSHWSMNGDRRAHVPCSPTSIYNIAVNENSDSNKVSTYTTYYSSMLEKPTFHVACSNNCCMITASTVNDILGLIFITAD